MTGGMSRGDDESEGGDELHVVVGIWGQKREGVNVLRGGIGCIELAISSETFVEGCTDGV